MICAGKSQSMLVSGIGSYLDFFVLFVTLYNGQVVPQSVSLLLAGLCVPCMGHDRAYNNLQLLREGEDNLLKSPHSECDRAFPRGFMETSKSQHGGQHYGVVRFSHQYLLCALVFVMKLTPGKNRESLLSALLPQPIHFSMSGGTILYRTGKNNHDQNDLNGRILRTLIMISIGEVSGPYELL